MGLSGLKGSSAQGAVPSGPPLRASTSEPESAALIITGRLTESRRDRVSDSEEAPSVRREAVAG